MIPEHRVAMSGASGLVGSFLSRRLRERGWEVMALTRDDFSAGPHQLARRLDGADTIVNLAGAPILGRWSEAYKRLLYDSRVGITGKLIDACSLLPKKPTTFLSTSAIGYYSSTDVHTEDRYVAADDFLGDLCRHWEEEALRAEPLGCRTVIFRLGVVLAKNGGALQKMILPFKLGLGGRIGSGSQAFSWIHIEDLAGVFLAAISDASFQGIYNVTAPEPATNNELTKALAGVLGRPALLPLPEFVLRLKFGEGAQVLTKGQRVVPKRLLDSGYQFQFSDLTTAVEDCVSG
jgi:uncharacterized protein (TIGR01777 family)